MDKETKTRLIVFIGVLVAIWAIIGLLYWLGFWGFLIILSLFGALLAAGSATEG